MNIRRTKFPDHAHVHCVGIRIAVDSHGLDAELSRSSHHTACNFSSVRDQDLVKHLGRALRHARERPRERQDTDELGIHVVALTARHERRTSMLMISS